MDKMDIVKNFIIENPSLSIIYLIFFVIYVITMAKVVKRMENSNDKIGPIIIGIFVTMLYGLAAFGPFIFKG